MVVGQDDPGNGGQVFNGDGGRMKARRSEPLHRRGAFGEDRVGQPVTATQFQKHGGMAQALQAAVGGGIKLGAS
ncbi:hypothetical protein G6F31_020819 [Rhizopus arrhizus]|nr:hypothetical protein G6F31_020819 [Rhizopus arrhizus]